MNGETMNASWTPLCTQGRNNTQMRQNGPLETAE
jgi:hypothetical protein